MKNIKDFINNSEENFINIDTEVYREYIFPNRNIIRIDNPLKLCVKESGHRIWNSENISFYVPCSWICIKWKTKENKPNFIK